MVASASSAFNAAIVPSVPSSKPRYTPTGPSTRCTMRQSPRANRRSRSASKLNELKRHAGVAAESRFARSRGRAARVRLQGLANWCPPRKAAARTLVEEREVSAPAARRASWPRCPLDDPAAGRADDQHALHPHVCILRPPGASHDHRQARTLRRSNSRTSPANESPSCTRPLGSEPVVTSAHEDAPPYRGSLGRDAGTAG